MGLHNPTGLSMEMESCWKSSPYHNLRQHGRYSSTIVVVVLLVTAVILPVVHAIGTRCTPVATHCCCNNTVVLPNGFGNNMLQLKYLHIVQPKTPSCNFQQCKQTVAAGCKQSNSKSNRIVWTSTMISA